MKADVESEKNRVTLDARMLGFTGIGSYVGGLLRGVASVASEFGFTVICSTPHAPLDWLSTRFRLVESRAPIYSLREQWQIPRLLDGTGLLHCPHYNVPYFYRGRLVVTIHDLTHLVHREFLPNLLAYQYACSMLRLAVQRAARIITVSQFSKDSIQERFRVPDEKIRVIYNGLTEQRPDVAGEADRERLRALRILGPYVLFVGLLKAHKNVQALLQAFALVSPETRKRFQLVIAGKKDNFYPSLCRLVRELSLEERLVFTGHVSDDDLEALYARATVFVLPSFNEGFGFPALEAMAHGVPVIVSDASSLPEVVGNAGILINPHDAQSIASAIERVVSDGELRQRLAVLGRERAQLFSAKESALQHLEVYREVLNTAS